MRIYQRTGPNTGISYGFGEGLLFWFLVMLGALPFIAVGIIVVLFFWAVGIALMVLLALLGIGYKTVTGHDAHIPVPGGGHGTAIEYWMEEKGWIRLPQILQPKHLEPVTISTRSTQHENVNRTWQKNS